MLSVIDFNPVSERLCTLHLRGYNITLINAYAPTEDKDNEVKEQYYEELQAVFNRIPTSDIKIIIGDFSAKVGQEGVYRPTIGLHSLHELSNRNGERLIDFAIRWMSEDTAAVCTRQGWKSASSRECWKHHQRPMWRICGAACGR